MASLATAMVSTLENVNDDGTQNSDDNTGFTTVERRRRMCADANHPPNNTPGTPSPPPTTKRPERPQRIEVITSRCATPTSSQILPVPVPTSKALHGRPNTGQSHPRGSHQHEPQHQLPPTYRDALHQRHSSSQPPHVNLHAGPISNPDVHSARTSGDTILIGTSLTRGVGGALRNHGVDVATYMYAGTHIPHIRSRLKGIFTPSHQPRRVILQCGGNDLESQPVDRVAHQYECLVNDVQRLYPNTSIIVSKIPLRRDKASILRKITAMNAHIDKMCSTKRHVQCIDACPKALEYFRRDMIHFNKDGIQQYAATLVGCLNSLDGLNFHQAHNWM